MSDIESALAVWRAARDSEGRAPDDQRVARVRAKLVDPDAVLVTASRQGRCVGMALAEPYLTSYGAGSVVAGTAHVSMVFVDPAYQRSGIGRELVAALVEALPATTLSLWTRDTKCADPLGAADCRPLGLPGRRNR